MYRCTAGRQDLTAERTLGNALRSCEEELKQLVHPPLLQTAVLIVQPKRRLSSVRSQKLYISKSSDRPIPRDASIALGEKFTLDQASTSTIQTPAKKSNVYKKGDGLNMVMRQPEKRPILFRVFWFGHSVILRLIIFPLLGNKILMSSEGRRACGHLPFGGCRKG